MHETAQAAPTSTISAQAKPGTRLGNKERLVVQVARAAARAVPGASPELIVAVASRESGLDQGAVNPTSGTGGLFQFSDDTWLEAVRRHAAKHGHADLARSIRVQAGMTSVSPASRRRIIAMRHVPLFSALMAAEMLVDARHDAEAALGRAARGVDLYVIHAKGEAGGTAFLRGVAAGRNKSAYGLLAADMERRQVEAAAMLSLAMQPSLEVAMAPPERRLIVDKHHRLGYQ